MEDYLRLRDWDHSLLLAVREGRLERVEELISYFDLFDPSGEWAHRYVLLREALKNNHSEITKLLLRNCSKVNRENKIPTATPLHFAVRNGDIEIVQILLDKDANIDVECEYGATPLHVAVQTNRMEITKLLLSRGANVNAEGNYCTAMFYNAMKRRNEKMLGDLSEHGIHPNSLRTSILLPEGFTPLHVAVRNGSEEMIKLLLNKDANVNAEGKYGITPLHVAMEEGYLQIVELLLNHGANINSAYTSSSMKGYTPLCIAVINRQEEVVNLLLERGANVNAQDQVGRTILHFAVEDRCSLIIEHLLRHSPDVNNKCALNIAMHGCEKKYSKIVKNLLEYEFNVASYIDCKSCPSAVLKEYQKINEERCECGTNVNVIPATLLLRATETLRTLPIPKHITQLVINNGATVNCDPGKTPIFYAAEKNCRDIIEVLLQHGADVNSSDECGKGPFSEELLEGPLDKVSDISEIREIARLHLSRPRNIIVGMNSLYLTEDNFIVYAKPFEIVSQNSNLEIVEVLLKFVDFKDKDGRTVLRVASHYNNLEIVEVLKFGTGTDFEGEHGGTPVHIASKRSKPEIVEVLSRFGADVDSKDQYGRTALHIASENSNLEMVETLIKFGAGVDSKDQYGRTALHIASENSNLEMVETLIKFGAGVDFRDKNGKTALHLASENSNAQIVKVLLKCISDIDSKDHCGRTALHIASRTGNLEIVKVLLKNGAGADFKDEHGTTALHIASRWSNLQIVELLLKFGASVDSNDNDGRTALHIASKNNNLEIVDALLKVGASVDSKDENGTTALHIASENINLEIVEALLKFGASVDTKDKNGTTALHFASENNNLEIVDALLKVGASVDSKVNSGRTALHFACEKRNLQIVEVLLKFGADIDYRDEEGATALCLACMYWGFEIVKVLLDHGADIPIVSETEDSMLRVCINRGNSDDEDYKFVVPGSILQNFKRHAVKVKAANLYVRNTNLASIRTDDEVLRDFQNECENEVASMKSEVLGNANISFYDILTKGLRQLAIYAGNESIVQVFKSDDYKMKFPIYATLINSRFRKGKRRRELMVQGIKNFYFCTNSLGIPYDCIEKIFNYLSNDDIRSLMHACKPISVSSLNTDKK